MLHEKVLIEKHLKMRILKIAVVGLTVAFSIISCAQKSEKSIEVVSHLSDHTTEIDTNWKQKVIKTDAEWKSILTEDQYHITREQGTERPFTHEFNDVKEKGVFLCVSCDNPLFGKTTKFNSGTGWPSFYAPYFSKSVKVGQDDSEGMSRDEVSCARCNAHLGHVFNDGPQPTGLRYCIDGIALKFQAAQKLEKVVFAQGCFWCTEHIFEAVKGVKEVISGYAGGKEKNPTYEEVGGGSTSHAEAIEVTYDFSVISYEELLKVYFNSGDITQVNGQGNDVGKQYRSIVFYNNETQKKAAENYIQKLNQSGNYTKKIAVEVVANKKFYVAEDYHQDYVKHNPNQGYVRGVSILRYKKAITHFPELLK